MGSRTLLSKLMGSAEPIEPMQMRPPYIPSLNASSNPKGVQGADVGGPEASNSNIQY